MAREATLGRSAAVGPKVALCEVTRIALRQCTLLFRSARLSDVGHAVQKLAETNSYGVIRDFVGAWYWSQSSRGLSVVQVTGLFFVREWYLQLSL